MSIIIKGLDMPKSCGECHFFEIWGSTNDDGVWESGFECQLIGKLGVEDISLEDISPHCPLIEYPKGKWTEVYNENEKPFFNRQWVCSNCGKGNTYGTPKYCPHCGAKMKGE